MSNTRLLSGSSVKAGPSMPVCAWCAGVRYACARAAASRSPVPLTAPADGGHELGHRRGAFPLANSRDSVMTPDFEITLNGPAVFHLAISTDETGSTCVQSLHGNTGSVTISELMGDGSYTLMPGDQKIFRAGHANNPGPVMTSCGCPPDIAVERAAAEPPSRASLLHLRPSLRRLRRLRRLSNRHPGAPP